MLRTVDARERFVKARQLPRRVVTAADFDQTVDRAILKDLSPAEPFIDRTTNVITIGSCFAMNIEASLAASGYKTLRVNVSERLFNPFALQTFVEALGPVGDFSDFEKHWGVAAAAPEAIRNGIAEGAIVIITFGLSFVWIDKNTGEIVFDPARKVGTALIREDPERFEMQPTGVAENTEAMAAIINAIRGLNRSTKIILTLSPVHLARAISDYPGIVADSISKSTLRCALHEIMSLRLAGVYYFPSFEILRWFAPMVDVVFGGDDLLAHIQPQWVDYTLSKFKHLYCVGEQSLPPPFIPRGSPSTRGT
jgi:hypothetical protein